jgi:hypothetical protein
LARFYPYRHHARPAKALHGIRPAIKKDGKVLDRGYIGLQAESQPVEFCNIRLLNLAGCMNASSPAYRAYFVHREDTRCTAAPAVIASTWI